MNYILEIESKNKSDAQKRASEILGIPEDELDFETEGAGLFGMMARKPVVVRVKPKNEPGACGNKGWEFRGPAQR